MFKNDFLPSQNFGKPTKAVLATFVICYIEEARQRYFSSESLPSNQPTQRPTTLIASWRTFVTNPMRETSADVC